MRTLAFTIFLFCAVTSHAQEFEYDAQYDTIALGTRDYYLNSQLRSDLLEGTNRSLFSFDLPENTIKWYYSFTTQEGESGSANLGLVTKLVGMAIDPTLGIQGISVPKGVANINAYVLGAWSTGAFLNGERFNYETDFSSLSSPQGIVEVTGTNAKQASIGFTNPSQTNGVHVFVEAVAITETKTLKNIENISKAETYGQLALTKFNYGQYEVAKAYCDSSLANYELGWVYGTQSACFFVLEQEGRAAKTLVKGIDLMKIQGNYNYNIKLIQKQYRVLKKKAKRGDAQQYIDLLWEHRFLGS
jgi:hypothetical protein